MTCGINCKISYNILQNNKILQNLTGEQRRKKVSKPRKNGGKASEQASLVAFGFGYSGSFFFSEIFFSICFVVFSIPFVLAVIRPGNFPVKLRKRIGSMQPMNAVNL